MAEGRRPARVKRYGLIAALVILALVVIAGWVLARERRTASEAEGRYQAIKASLEAKETALTALLPALEARDRDLVERLVAAQAREKALVSQLTEAKRATAVSVDRAAALKTAPLAEVLRAGEALGIKARAR